MKLFRISTLALFVFCGNLHFATYGSDGDGPNAQKPSSANTGMQTSYSLAFSDPSLYPVPKPPSDIKAVPYEKQQKHIKGARRGNKEDLNWVLKGVEWGILQTPLTWEEILGLPDLQEKALELDDRIIHLLVDYYIYNSHNVYEIPELPFFENLKEKVVFLANQGSAVHQYFAGILIALKKQDNGLPPQQENEPILTPLSNMEKEKLTKTSNNSFPVISGEVDDILNRTLWGNLRLPFPISLIQKSLRDTKVTGNDRDIRHVNLILKCAKKMDDLSAFPGLEVEIRQNARDGSELDKYFLRDLNAIKEYEDNKTQSHAYFTKSAKQGYAHAHFALADFWYVFNDAVDMSNQEIQSKFKHLRSAAELGYARALAYLGIYHVIRAEFKESEDPLYRAAIQGEMQAQKVLGDLYLEGNVSTFKAANLSLGFSWHWMSQKLSDTNLWTARDYPLTKIIQVNNNLNPHNRLWNEQVWQKEFEEILDQLDAVITPKDKNNQLNGKFQENQTAAVFLGDNYTQINTCLEKSRIVLAELDRVRPLFMITHFMAKPGITYTVKGKHTPPFLFVKPFEECGIQGITIDFSNIEIMDLLLHLKNSLISRAISCSQKIISAYETSLSKKMEESLTAKIEAETLETMSTGLPSDEILKKREKYRFKIEFANACYSTLKNQLQQVVEENSLLTQIQTLLNQYIVDGAGTRNTASKKAFPYLFFGTVPQTS